MKVKRVKLSELVPDAANVRKHPDRNRQTIAASLKQFGAARSIVVDGKGVVRAGNGTLEAALAAGIEDALVVESDGAQLVVVKRKDWSDSEALAYAIADNRSAELAAWDEKALAAVLEELRTEEAISELATGFTAEEIESLANSASLDDVAREFAEIAAGQGEGSAEEKAPAGPSNALTLVITGTRESINRLRELIGRARQGRPDMSMADALLHLADQGDQT